MRDIAPPSFLGVVILSFEGFTEFLSPYKFPSSLICNRIAVLTGT